LTWRQHLRRARADARVDFDRGKQNVNQILTEIDRLDEIAPFSRYGARR
jgi:hypothetical protein